MVLRYKLPKGLETREKVRSIEAAAALVARSEGLAWGYTEFELLTDDGEAACPPDEWRRAVRAAKDAWPT